MENSVAKFWSNWGQNIRRKHQDKWRNNSWTLHHDNARVHASLVVRQFLASTNMTVIPHPPHSLEFAPCDFFLFPNLLLKGRRFDNIKQMQTVSQNVMKTLTWNDFQQCFPSWKSSWNRCINAERDYFEGGWGRTGISVSGTATADEFRALLGSTSYMPVLRVDAWSWKPRPAA